MASHARFVGSGVQPIVDAVRAAGGDPGDLRTAVWQATWARGYEDVVTPAPAIRLKEEGFVVFARPISDRRYAAIVDTTHALWAVVARGAVAPLGARVRIVPAFVDGEIGWEVTVVETLGASLSIRFGARAGETTEWLDRLRTTLLRIAEGETERRRAIVNERRSIMALEHIKPFRAEIDVIQEALRQRIDAETAGTASERAAFERGNEKQRKAIVDECKARRVKRYNEEMLALRERIPEMHAEYDRRVAANTEIRIAVADLEAAASRSRSISERIATVEKQLAAVAAAGLLVGADLDVLDGLGSADFAEISRSAELLFDLIPRRGQKRQS